MKKNIILMALCGLSGMMLYSQSLNLKVGFFRPTLNSDLWQTNLGNLTFNKSDMLKEAYAIEYEHYLNPYSSLSFEIGHYYKAVYAQYRDYEYPNGDPIFQNLSLSLTPITLNVKIYPAGHRRYIMPYIGVGAGVLSWRYEQWGDFINFDDMSISQDKTAITSTYSFLAVGRVGFLLRLQRFLGFSVEAQYQYAKGTLSGYFIDFKPLDLSGFSAFIGLNIFFR